VSERGLEPPRGYKPHQILSLKRLSTRRHSDRSGVRVRGCRREDSTPSHREGSLSYVSEAGFLLYEWFLTLPSDRVAWPRISKRRVVQGEGGATRRTARRAWASRGTHSCQPSMEPIKGVATK